MKMLKRLYYPPISVTFFSLCSPFSQKLPHHLSLVVARPPSGRAECDGDHTPVLAGSPWIGGELCVAMAVPQ